MNIGSLFSGAGGLDLAALELFPDASMAWHCEVDPAASKVLAHHWPGVRNLGDVSTVDWSTVCPVDVVVGGFPCQDLSAAGRRVGLTDGSRSGLWSYMRAAVDVLRPQFVLIENVRGLLSAPAVRNLEPEADALGDFGSNLVLRALGTVLGDLATIGFDAEWACVQASDVGACHHRSRVFIFAYRGPSDQGYGTGVLSRAVEPVSAAPYLPTPDTGVSPNGHGRRGGTAGNGYQSGTNLDAVVKALAVVDAAADGASLARRGWHVPDGVPDWGGYAPMVRRQEQLFRPAPPPLELNFEGRRRLSAAFAEWMMAWPEGWVTDPRIGLSRTEQLRVIGNGVVPPQAVAGFRYLRSIAGVRG